jgi:hypothetical protein
MGSWKALKTTAGSGWKEIDRAAGTGWKELSWDAVNIDVGAACIMRATGSGGNATFIGTENPANANGTITDLCVWCRSASTGCKIGSFYIISGNTLKCRDADVVGALGSGKNEKTVSLNIQSGDFIGIYIASGQIEVTLSGSNFYTISGDKCIIDNESSYNILSRTQSVYGEG